MLGHWLQMLNRCEASLLTGFFCAPEANEFFPSRPASLACEAAASADRCPGSGTVAIGKQCPLFYSAAKTELQQTSWFGPLFFVGIKQFFCRNVPRASPHSEKSCVSHGQFPGGKGLFCFLFCWGKFFRERMHASRFFSFPWSAYRENQRVVRRENSCCCSWVQVELNDKWFGDNMPQDHDLGGELFAGFFSTRLKITPSF